MNRPSNEEPNNNYNENAKKWFSIEAALGYIFVISIIWIICISIAWNIGSWVGASLPIPGISLFVAFLPSIIDVVIAIVCLGFWIKSRSGTLMTLFVTALVMAGFQFLLTGWFLAMGSIT